MADFIFPSVYSITRQDFDKTFPFLPAYRFTQLVSLRRKGFDDMALYRTMGGYALSFLREALPGGLFSTRVEDAASGADSSKIIIGTTDDLEFEAVRINSFGKEGPCACLSSQVGCECGCAFCSTGSIPFARNLRDFEMIEQFHHLGRLFGELRSVVFMGMGEPLLNLDAVAATIRHLTAEEGLSIRNITVSTSGIAGKIRQLASKCPGVRLAVSIVSTDERTRQRLMPIAKGNPLAEIKKALVKFQSDNRRRITLAYPLLRGVNDSKADALGLRAFASGLICHVNVIPFNEGGRGGFERPSDADVERFCDLLDRMRVPFSVRHSKGRGMSAACGELALRRVKAKNGREGDVRAIGAKGERPVLSSKSRFRDNGGA